MPRWAPLIVLLAAQALAEGPVQRDHVEVELIAEHTSVQPGGKTTVALRFRMDPLWHIYWRNPGDSGMAPTFAWEVADGVRVGPAQWPVPVRIPAGPFMTFAYEDEVLLLAELHVPAGFEGDVLRIGAKASWLVCEEVCLAGEAELELKLKVRADAPQPDARWTGPFARTRAALPQDAPPGALAAVARDGKVVLRVTPERMGTLLRGGNWNFFGPYEKWDEDASVPEAREDRGSPGSVVAFFPAENGVIQYNAEQPLTRGEAAHELVLTPAAEREGKPVDRLRGVLAVAGRALAVDVPVGRAAAAAPAKHESSGTPLAFAGFLLGAAAVLYVVSLGLGGVSAGERGSAPVEESREQRPQETGGTTV